MSATLASISADVMALTNRYGLVNETALAVKAATLKAHQSDDYLFDFQESAVQFSTSDYYQSFDFKTVFPLWRKPKYFRKYDDVGSMPGDFFKLIDPEKVIDEFKVDRTDVYYVAGAELQLRSSTQFQFALLGYYANPDVTTLGYSSWIANDFPFAIIYEAVAIIFKTIGKDSDVATYRDMVREQYQLLRQHAVSAQT